MSRILLLILAMLLTINIIGQANALDDDLDSFFDVEATGDDTIVKEQFTSDNDGIEGEGMPTPDQVQQIYIPEEITPEFENDSEKYMYYARKYIVEICLASLTFLFIANFFSGKSKNAQIAAMWLTEALPIIKENFAHLGFGDQPNASLSQITYDEFEYYASGRNNLKYMFINMRTKKRQDLVAGGLLGILWPSKDRLIMDIPIEINTPIELIMCRGYDIKRHIQEMPHLKGLVQPYQAQNFVEGKFGFLAEAPEVINAVFNRKFANAFSKYEKYMEFLHITDQQVYTKYPLVLKVEINLGDNPSEFKESAELFGLMFELVDHIVDNVRLPSKIMDKARQRRLEEEKQKNKEKESEEKQKIAEDKESKLREKLSTMTPADKKKYLQKLENQEKKRQMKGRNKVVKF